jgi:hypothetical protein
MDQSKMEQILERLLAKMDATQQKMDAIQRDIALNDTMTN